MTFVAICLLIALAAAGTIIVVQFGVLYRLSIERNEACDDADRAEAEADGLQVELNAALARLSRKPKVSAAALLVEERA